MKFTQFARAAIVASFAAVAPSIGAAGIFRGETAGVGDPVHAMFVAFANQAMKAEVQIQVNA